MSDDADFARAADDARRKFGHHRFDCIAEVALRQIAFYFATRSAMYESRAVDTDSFYKAVGAARLVGGVVKAVFERRRSAVDDKNFLRPLALERKPIRVLALAKRRGGAGWIGQQQLY